MKALRAMAGLGGRGKQEGVRSLVYMIDCESAAQQHPAERSRS